MMYWNDGGASWFWMVLMMTLLWGGIAATVVLVLRMPSHHHHDEPSTRDQSDAILAERFARGEIDEDEYKARQAVLKDRR